jgi:hypothetical protein
VFNLEVTHESRVWGRADEELRVDASQVPVPPYYPDTPLIRKDIARNYDNIMVMDSQVGDILQQLADDGLMDNTIIFFYSDHGSGLPRSKRWIFDSGLHVPFIIRYADGHRAGTVDDQLVSFVDFAPSMLSLLGLQVPDHMQGRAFLGEQQPEPREYIFAARDRMDPALETMRAVRDKRYKYIRNYRPDEPYLKWIPYRDQMNIMSELYRLRDAGELTEDQSWVYKKTKPVEELYDTERDPYELNNLAEAPEYQEKLVEMRQVHEQWKQETADLGHIPETVLIKMLWPPDGKQPTTAKPAISGNSGKGTIALQSPTEGASIAYRTDTTGPWLLYHQPLALDSADRLYARAIRIGFKESEELEVDLTKVP